MLVGSVQSVSSSWLICRERWSWQRQGPGGFPGECLWLIRLDPGQVLWTTFILVTWFRDSDKEGCWFIICSKQMTFPASDPGGEPRFLVGDLKNVQGSWSQHSLRVVNKVYIRVLLCRQSGVGFCSIIGIAVCPWCFCEELCVKPY